MKVCMFCGEPYTEDPQAHQASKRCQRAGAGPRLLVVINDPRRIERLIAEAETAAETR